MAWGRTDAWRFNQARRQPYGALTLEELRRSTVRIQENNTDAIIALAQRSFGSAYHVVAPMSVTLGMRECLSARRVRRFSDTGPGRRRSPGPRPRRVGLGRDGRS